MSVAYTTALSSTKTRASQLILTADQLQAMADVPVPLAPKTFGAPRGAQVHHADHPTAT